MEHINPFQNERQELSANDFKKALPKKGVLMGIDYGSVRIGLALSDSGWNRVMPFKTIAKIKELDDIVPAKNVVGFVVGLPLQTDGMEGNTAHQARLFADRLAEKFRLPILWVDERYTSAQAEAYLKDTLFMRADKRKKVLDAHAAVRVLERALQILE